MPTQIEPDPYKRGRRFSACLLWSFLVTSLGFTTTCALILLALVGLSTALNVWLGWQMTGFNVEINTKTPVSALLSIPTPAIAASTATPSPTTVAEVEPEATPTLDDAEAALAMQIATLSAVVTEAAEEAARIETEATAAPSPTATELAPSAATDTPVAAQAVSQSDEDLESVLRPTPDPATDQGAADFSTAGASSNEYSLIPIDGERDTSHLPEEHGDLNLKLREPQRIEVERSLIDIPDSGVDPEAPRFSEVFEDNFVAVYGIHNWDWNCNCKGALIQEEYRAVLVGIETTPGEDVFIPPTENDIYQGEFYAIVLFASEDSLTFTYAREGTVANGYTIHYEGLQTDPNLLALYRRSEGNQLPGLRLDTPVGTATDELIVAIRDNGTFLDARSREDWWQ